MIRIEATFSFFPTPLCPIFCLAEVVGLALPNYHSAVNAAPRRAGRPSRANPEVWVFQARP